MLARSALLILALLVLIGLLAYWWTLNDGPDSVELPERESVFAQQFSEPAFADNSSSDELMEHAQHQISVLQERFPESPLAWNVLGDFCFRTDDAEGATRAWQQSLQLDRGDADAMFGLANLAFEAGRFDEAAALCETIIGQNNNNPRVPLLLADTYLNQNKPKLAALTLEQHIASEPTSVQALEMLGSAYVRLKDYGEAIEILERVLQFSPKSTKAHYELGQAYLRKKEAEKAKKYLETFQELAQAESDATSIGAQRFADRAHAVSISSQVLADCSIAYRALGDAKASEALMLRALKLQPDRIPWLQELQSLYRQQNMLWETIDVLKRLAELEPENVDHLLGIGGLYSELGQPELAVEYFRKAIALAPQDERCIQAQKIIEQLNE